MISEIEAALQQMRQMTPNIPIFQIQDYLEIHLNCFYKGSSSCPLNQRKLFVSETSQVIEQGYCDSFLLTRRV